MFKYAFVDWDNTIYDTIALEADIFNIFAKYGVTKSDIKETFYRSLCTISLHQYDYTFEEHAQFLRDLGYKIPNEAVIELKSLFIKNYLFPDTLEFLQFLKNVSKKTILLSAGDQDFQWNKIQGSNISKHFDEIKIVSGDKEKYLVKNCDGSSIFFVNDNLRENIAVKQAMPSALVITKFNVARYSEKEVNQVGVPYFKTLSEIKQYVEQQIK